MHLVAFIGILFLGLGCIAGVVKVNQERIVGGMIATRGQFPHQISLRLGDDHYCGGSILNENWVITAAHCFSWTGPEIPEYYSVVANEYNIYVDEGTERIHSISKIIFHPEYDENDYPNDIALLKLKEPLIFDDWVSPIALPPANYTPAVGQMATVSGWGGVAQYAANTIYLHFLDVTFISDEDCRVAFSGSEYNITIVDSMICAGSPSKDTCHGDNGGPLITDGFNSSYYLSGVVGLANGECGQTGRPTVFAEVSKFLPWIEETIATY